MWLNCCCWPKWGPVWNLNRWRVCIRSSHTHRHHKMCCESALYEGRNTYMLWCLRISFHFYFTFNSNGVFRCTWKFIVRAKRSILSNFNPRFKKAFWISTTFDRCRKCTEWPLKLTHTYWLEVALSNAESAKPLHSYIQLLHSLTRTIFIVRARGHYIYVKDLKTYKYKVCRYVLKSRD